MEKEIMYCMKCGKRHEPPVFSKDWKCRACGDDLDYAPPAGQKKEE